MNTRRRLNCYVCAYAIIYLALPSIGIIYGPVFPPAHLLWIASLVYYIYDMINFYKKDRYTLPVHQEIQDTIIQEDSNQ
jgi:uncharacterized membrane protein